MTWPGPPYATGAEDVERRFKQAWAGADVTLRASRF